MVTDKGEAAAIPLHVLPQAEKPSEGVMFNKISSLSKAERLAALFALPAKTERAEGWFVLTVTRQGMVKKSSISELPGASAQTFALCKINPSDRLGWALLTDGKADLLMGTAKGMAIRFSEDEVRPMGLNAAGVVGIKLQEGDEVVGVILAPNQGEVLLVASDGTAKRVSAAQFPRQGRYGQGVIAWRLPHGVKMIGMASGKNNARFTLHMAETAAKSIRLDEAIHQGRAARGKAIIEIKPGDQVVGLTIPWDMPRPISNSI